jgi:NodT family efflux transporter outer membrane factor (OMF) lipoprotein
MRKACAANAALIACLAGGGCMVGPKYQKPAAPVTPAFKESLPEGWKRAEPNDDKIRGKWWEMYNDPELNRLEEQVAISNENVLAFAAQYREAAAAVKVARSALFPTISVAPSITQSFNASTHFTSGGNVAATGRRTFYSLPFDASWEPDVWGNIRRSVTAASAQAQATAADLANATLSFQSQLAQDYFSLHGLDGDIDVLQKTVRLYAGYLKLTKDQFVAGTASDLTVAQAEAQFEAAQAQLINYGVARAQFEHAVAVLGGKPPAKLSVEAILLKPPPPSVPVTVPSVLLERRPDIAAQERLMAAANEQIGIAKAAYFPTTLLTGSIGFQASSFTSWLTWPSRFYTVGSAVSETIFDFGKRRGTLVESEAAYHATVASYRQTVLTAFQQVEDALAAERIYQEEAGPVAQSVKTAERQLALSTAQYAAGTVDYLTVIVAQTTLLSTQLTQVNLLANRLVANVQLIASLGGGWDLSQLPNSRDVNKAGR